MTIITKVPESVRGDASTALIRPRFSAGLLLQDDDLTQAVDYLRGVTRLLFRSMLGCGVLCGFEVKPSIVCNNHLRIEIERGVALDCNGDLIETQGTVRIEYGPPCANGVAELPKEVWILICHRERDCEPRDTLCSPQDDEISPVYTRTREGYEIKVIERKEDAPQLNCCAGVSTYGKPASVSTDGKQEKSEVASKCCDYIATPTDGNDWRTHHYRGDCACNCQCDCIVLARVLVSEAGKADVDHSVRRFIRPVLMRDPLPPVASAASPAPAPSPSPSPAPAPAPAPSPAPAPAPKPAEASPEKNG